MATPAYYGYQFEGTRFTFCVRRGGASIAEEAALGPDHHFDRFVHLVTSEPGWLSVDVSGWSDAWFDCYGGFIADFDTQVLVLYIYYWGADLELDGVHVTSFGGHPHLARHLRAVLASYWPGWDVVWVDEDEYRRCLTGQVSPREVQSQPENLPDWGNVATLDGARLQECYRERLAWFLNYYR